MKMNLNSESVIPERHVRYSGYCWYCSNTRAHCASPMGGMTPEKGRHSTIERPASVSRVGLEAFVRGTDGAVWHRAFDGAAWSGWSALPGVLAFVVLAVLLRASGGTAVGSVTGAGSGVIALKNGSASVHYALYNNNSTNWIFNRPSAGVWAPIGVAIDTTSAANNPTIFLSGSKLTVGAGLTKGSVDIPWVTTPETWCVGNRPSDNARAWDGSLAEFAVWNVILTDAEFAALQQGASPETIRPEARIHYLPAERDGWLNKDGVRWTVTGTKSPLPHPTVRKAAPSTRLWLASSTAPSGDTVGSSTGIATVSGVGASVAASTGSSSGLATVSGVGDSASSAGATGSAAGSSTASGVGASTAASTGSADGVATVSGVGSSSTAGSSTGSASGSSTVNGVSASIAASVGSASGEAVVTGRTPVVVIEAEFSGGFPYIDHDERRKKQRVKLGIVKDLVPPPKASKIKGLEGKKAALGPTPQERRLAQQEALNAELRRLVQVEVQLELEREEEAIVRMLMEL